MIKTLLAVFAFFSFAPLAIADEAASDETDTLRDRDTTKEEKVEVSTEEDKTPN